jgi:acid phosphatase
MLLYTFGLALVAVGVVEAASSASRPTYSTIQPSLTQILATQATAPALSPVSNVKGQAFDRIIQIWLENTVRGLQ